jgi:hypothetical protein
MAALKLKNWRTFRHQSGMFYNQSGQIFRVGEKGMADNSAIWHLETPDAKPKLGLNYTLWVEFKRDGFAETCGCCVNAIGKPKECTFCGQRRWRDAMKELGALVIRVSSVQDFISWYDNRFGFLHTGAAARGQLELLVDVPAEQPVPVLDPLTLELPKASNRWSSLRLEAQSRLPGEADDATSDGVRPAPIAAGDSNS